MIRAKSNQWQVRIEMCKLLARGFTYETNCVYGDTTDFLRQAVKAYLLYETKMLRFRNVGDHLVGRMTYFYSNGVSHIEDLQPQPLERGWWCQKGRTVSRQIQESLKRSPEKLGSFEAAIDHFVANAMIPERGPDYHSKAIVGGEFQLNALEKTIRETEEYPVNDLIQRGWHIIAVEYQSELTKDGVLMNRKACLVLGHPDGQAATYSLNSDHYKIS